MSKPSISTSNWFRVCSRSSLPPPIPVPRCRPTASISSMKMMAGADCFACSNRSRTREAPTPTNISTKSLPEIEKKGTPASPATALATRVFPVPGGPYSKTPLGILAPSAWNFLGSFKNSLISTSSSMASSMPATSAKVTFEVSLVTIFALDLPKFITPRPPPDIDDIKNQNSARMITNGRREPSKARYQGVLGTSSVQPSAILASEIAFATATARPETK